MGGLLSLGVLVAALVVPAMSPSVAPLVVPSPTLAPSLAPSLVPTPAPSPAVSDVCAASARTVERGLTAFVATLQRAADGPSAESAVREAGTILVTLGRDLRAEAGQVTGAIGDTLRDLADEFDRQGRALTGVAAVRTFDSRRLEALAERMSSLCGGPPR